MDGDLVMERRLLRRRLVIWRCVALGFFLSACVVAFGIRHVNGVLMTMPHIARLSVSGVMGSDFGRVVKALDKASGDVAIRGLVLAIDSPGGAVAGGEALHDAVMRFARHKPVVVTMGGTAASAGYMIAVPATRIFAHPSTLTGSIGVIMEAPDASRLLDRIGVSVTSIVSGPLKGQPSPTAPVSPEGRVMLQGIVDDLFGQFVDMVAQGRHMTIERVRSLADGRPYTGRQAVGLGLIDQLGTETDALAWLRHRLDVAPAFPVLPLIPAKTSWQARWRLREALSALPGSEMLGRSEALLGLDGPVALLQL